MALTMDEYQTRLITFLTEGDFRLETTKFTFLFTVTGLRQGYLPVVAQLPYTSHY
eukprot:SAG22_NODE_3357_length_1759_cov_1.766867_1_plen_54_part_10